MYIYFFFKFLSCYPFLKFYDFLVSTSIFDSLGKKSKEIYFQNEPKSFKKC